MEPVQHIAAAVKAVRDLPDTEDRYRAATDLEQHLAEARVLVAAVRRGAVVEMHQGGLGLKRLAERLQLSRPRVQALLRQAAAEAGAADHD